MGAVAERGKKERSSRVSTRSSLGVEHKRVNVGRDGRTCPIPELAGSIEQLLNNCCVSSSGVVYRK